MKQPPLFSGFWLVGAVSVLVAQPAWTQVAQVTSVQLQPTGRGLEVILKTTGTFAEVLTSSSGQDLITDIPNAQLRLPEGQAFRQDNPTQDIASVTVTNQSPNQIRVTVTGKAEVPNAEVLQSPQGLILSLTTSPAAAQPTPAPAAPPAEPEQPEPPEIPAPTETPEAQTESGEAIELVVTAEREEGYRVPTATTGTRTDTPIHDIPQSIQVVPEQVLEDQQVTRLEEALRNVSSVIFSGNVGGRGNEYIIRGFEDAPILQDGFRRYGAFGSFPEVANLERVEVLKGPASILYGEIQPGGAINLVSKKPLSEPFYEAELQVGSRAFVRPRFDLSGPLTSDGSLLYRLNGLYQRGDSFRGFDQEERRFFVAPSLSWNISDRTDLTVSLEYTDDKRPVDFGLPAFGNGVVDVPRDRIANEPDDTIANKYLNVGYNLEHRFNENWKLRNAFRYSSYDYDYNVVALTLDFDETTGTETRFFASQEGQDENYALQTNLIGEFATGPINHTLLFGVDLSRNDERTVSVGDFDTPIPLNIFNPVYRRFLKPDERTLPIIQGDEITSNRLGIYVQDQISLLDNLKLLAGLRYDTVEQKTVIPEATLFDPEPGEQTQNNDALSPRVGIVYQPIEPLSLYASYSQSFNPTTETTFNGDPLEPERGEGYEAGVKAELLKGKLFTTLAYFDITKQNVATPDPNTPSGFGSVATGEQRSQGVELDAVGEILPGWNIIASYTYTDARVTEDNAVPIGNRLFGTPRHSASLWTTYEIQNGDLQGLGFGVGFNYVGEREGDLLNSFEVDSYFISNTAIFYQRNNWRLGLNFKNLFNTNYIEAVANNRADANYPGEPFTVLGSVSVQF